MQQHLSSSNYHVPEKVKRETVQKISDLALNHTVITHLTLFEGLKEPHQETKMKKKKALNSSLNICRLRMADNEIKSQFRGCSFSHAAENRLFFIFISLSLVVSVSGREILRYHQLPKKKKRWSLFICLLCCGYFLFIFDYEQVNIIRKDRRNER